MSMPSPAAHGAFRAADAAGELIYAIGDIHGRYDLVIPLLATVFADAQKAVRERPPQVIFLGDYVDRGPDSAKVIEALVRLEARSGYRLTFLKGNHEQAMLDFIEDADAGRDWIRFGGAPTLAAYGVAPPKANDKRAAFERARRALLVHLPPAHLDFLQRLEVMAQVGDYAFVHAGIRPGRALAVQTDDDLLWIRDAFIGHPGPHEKVIVHGHTWIDDQPRILQQRIGVDTGAYETGVLTALRIEDGDIRFLQARGASSAPSEERALALQSQ